MTRLFNFFKNNLDIIRPLLFAVIGAVIIWYLCKPDIPQYIQYEKTINLKDYITTQQEY